MRRVFIVISLCLIADQGAFAQSQAQKNVMNHVAQALVLANGCPQMKPRNLLMAMLLTENKIDVERSPFKEYMLERGAELTRKMAAYSHDVVCQSARLLYGDKGQNVPHLLQD